MHTGKEDFIPAKRRSVLTTCEVVKMLRELKGWTQEDLAKACGINAKNISLLENNRLDIGKKSALQFAAAFCVHPAIIMFSQFEACVIGKTTHDL